MGPIRIRIGSLLDWCLVIERGRVQQWYTLSLQRGVLFDGGTWAFVDKCHHITPGQAKLKEPPLCNSPLVSVHALLEPGWLSSTRAVYLLPNNTICFTRCPNTEDNSSLPNPTLHSPTHFFPAFFFFSFLLFLLP
jgi:hypothetical protein